MTSEPRLCPERSDLLKAVEEIAPALERCADETEGGRTLAPAAVEALHARRLFAFTAPREVGGLEADPLTKTEVIEATSRIDANAGWTLMIGSAVSNLMGICLPQEGIDEVFGGPRWPVGCAQFNPTAGRASRADGGLRVSGHWSFASGIRHSDWVVCLGLFVRDGKPVMNECNAPELFGAVVPIDRVEVIDNWHVAGLRGTGSCDFAVDDVWVPHRRWFRFPPGSRERGGAVCHMNTLPAEHAGFALGVARRALDEVTALAQEKVRLGSHSTVAHRPVFQTDLGRAEIALGGARAMFLDAIGDVWDSVRSGSTASEGQTLYLRSATTWVTDIAMDVVTTALRYGGAGALRDSSPLQRCFRDMRAAAQHIYVSDEQ